MNNEEKNGRTVTELLADIKRELQDFVETRVAILRTELAEKLKTLKVALPLAVVAALLLLTASLLFTLAVVGLVAAFLPDGPYRWGLAFLAIGFLWTILGGIAAYFAKREFEIKEMLPRRTIAVLKQDRSWIQSEVKNQV